MFKNIEINAEWYYHRIDMFSMKGIFQSRAILSKRKQGYHKTDTCSWNGLDYISVAKRISQMIYDSFYQKIIRGQYAFVLDKIDIIPTKYKKKHYDFFRTISTILPNQWYSCYRDEYQVKDRIVKDRITIEKIIGIKIPEKDQNIFVGYPSYMTKDCYIDLYLKNMEEYKIDLPFFDIEEGLQIDQEEIKRYLITR